MATTLTKQFMDGLFDKIHTRLSDRYGFIWVGCNKYTSDRLYRSGIDHTDSLVRLVASIAIMMTLYYLYPSKENDDGIQEPVNGPIDDRIESRSDENFQAPSVGGLERFGGNYAEYKGNRKDT